MNLYMAGSILLKVTLLFALALCALTMMRRTTAQMRHLLCGLALAGSLLVPLTLPIAPRALAIKVPIVFEATVSHWSRAAPVAASMPRLILIVWAVGAAFLIVRLGLGCWMMACLVRNAKPSGEERVVWWDAPVPVFTAEVSVPLITGLFRPVILLPPSAASWPSLHRSAAVKHELTHLERNDLWTSLAAHLACAVYWFHPLAWILANRLRDEQETACDDAVIHSGFEATSYAEALIAAARQVTTTPMIGCPMITRTNEPSLKSRIARLLDRSKPRASSPATLRRVALLFGLTLTAIVMLNAGPQAPVYKVGDGITAPRVLYKVDPDYTDEARDAKISGTVLLSVVVGADGVAHDMQVVHGPGAGLEAKAVEAVGQWRFKPGELKGEPVAVRAQIEINFKLK